jgi:crossover junction endodeoxyribonuclease RuvC
VLPVLGFFGSLALLFVIILGIDPGTAKMGFGVICAKNNICTPRQFGCFETSRDLAPQKRLLALEQRLEEVFNEHSPDVIAMENIFFFKNAKTVIRVSQAQGVVLLCAEKHNINVVEYTPLQVKVALTGYGRAEKSQVQKTVQQTLLLNELPKPDDAADALAVALCHFWHQRFNEKVDDKKRI